MAQQRLMRTAAKIHDSRLGFHGTAESGKAAALV